MTKQEIIIGAKNGVTAKFDMLNGWNVGADTSINRYLDDVLDAAMNEYATHIAKAALLHHGISENVAYYTVEQLLKEKQ